MNYAAPVKDMLFVKRELAGLKEIAALPGFEDAGEETAQAVLEEAAKFCGEVRAPLNVEGGRNPSAWEDGNATATPGFKEAFRQFAEGGWQMARALLVATAKHDEDPSFSGAKIADTQFYAEHMLPHAAALETLIVTAKSDEGVLALSEERF